MTIHNRLFFALTPPRTIGPAIAQVAQSLRTTQDLGGRLINPARYHITLYFLGDEVTADVESAAMRAASELRSAPFNLKLDCAGSFNNPQIPVWLGPRDTPNELAQLEETIRKKMAHLPRVRQPRFNPHLTIIRNANRKLPSQVIEPIEWAVSEFVLIRSVLNERPARYDVLARYALCGPPLPPQPEQESFSFG